MGSLDSNLIWGRPALDSAGALLGTIEAIGMGRGAVARRVGVRMAPGDAALKFFSLEGSRMEGEAVVLSIREADRAIVRLRVPG